MLFHLLCLPMILLSVAFFSLFERKVMGAMQIRKGPNKVGQGLLQPVADATKLVSKPELTPSLSVKSLFFLPPLLLFACSSFFWVFYPMLWGGEKSSMWGWGMVLIVYSISVYGLIFCGWYSNSKFSTLGVIRSVAQSLSYEVGLTFIICFFMVVFNSMSMLFSSHHIESGGSLVLTFCPFVGLIAIILLAELNRSPFDLSEGESELVSGFNVEYGGLSYTLIFLGEILSLLWSSVIVGAIFLPELIPVIVWWFVWVRSTEPRIRYDKLMSLFWSWILPIALGAVGLYLGGM